jgi:endogenous inhibitor of DNA gyrase (YacG/DUF329 family)
VTSGSPATRKVPCPTCGQPAVYAPFNPFRPFCSERCRLMDLGAWATEAYRIPAKPAEDEGDADVSGASQEPKT